MSSLFGVSTDYLLKDDLDKELPSEREEVYEAPETRSVSLEEANEYLKQVGRWAWPMALGVFLCVLSPIPLLILAGLSEVPGRVPWLSEDMAGGFGMTILLVLVAIGVAVFVLIDMRMEKYGYIEKEKLTLQYGVEGIVRKKKEDFTGRYQVCTVAGVVLCIIGVIPLMLVAGFSVNDLGLITCVAILLGMVAVAALLFVWAGSIWDGFNKLLQEGDYTVERKELRKKTSFFPGVYWCVVTALFLSIGFFTDEWVYAGLVWPVAALLFVATQTIVKEVVRGRQKRV